MSVRKIIFLDIDGVLNCQLSHEDPNRVLIDNIDEKCMEYLNMLCSATGADVVITSVWRLGRTVEKLQSILDKRGFKHRVIGKTKDLRIGEYGDCILRGNEILQWIKENTELIGVQNYSEYKSYLILDDDSDMLYWQRNNFICVDHYCGMTPKTVFVGKQILNRTFTDEGV